MLTRMQLAAAVRVRSLLVMKRAGFKLCYFVIAASGQILLGYEFAKTLATLALLTGILAFALGVGSRENVRAPYYTHFDEASWFLLLGQIVRRLL